MYNVLDDIYMMICTRCTYNKLSTVYIVYLYSIHSILLIYTWLTAYNVRGIYIVRIWYKYENMYIILIRHSGLPNSNPIPHSGLPNSNPTRTISAYKCTHLQSTVSTLQQTQRSIAQLKWTIEPFVSALTFQPL